MLMIVMMVMVENNIDVSCLNCIFIKIHFAVLCVTRLNHDLLLDFNFPDRLSGYSPFAGDDNHQTFQFVNQADYDFDDEVWERVSDDAKDFIKNLLIKDKK